MKGRIAISIHDLDGEVMACTGRCAAKITPEGTNRCRIPKLFLKTLAFYNLHRPKEIAKRYPVIGEGSWSVVWLNEAGIPAAALMGTSLSPSRAELDRKAGFRYANLLLDGDKAGPAAAPEAVPEATFVLSQSV